MFIVPLFPALFANRLLAYWTTHTRGSACLPPILCTQFSSELLSITHLAITPRYHPKTHPHVGTLICRQTCSAFVLHSYFCFLRWWMRNTNDELCWASRGSSLRSSISAGLPLYVVFLGELKPRRMHRTSRLHVLFPLVLKSP
jgi:hypothetical protein